MKPGDLISGKYRLLRPLGAGGMGSVWAARNELTHRDFAIKFLHTELAQNQEALQRFFQEARICGQLRHPAVVDVFDLGQAEDGSPYIVMELLEGEGLDTRLKSAGVLLPVEAAEWMAFVARGLEEAHVHGVVHRDLKPGNIFLARQPTGEMIPKILDFGVSKATGPKAADHIQTVSGAVLGSPAYMSPEQARGELEIDSRSDIWSMGVILYESLTGQLPFRGANYNALMVAIMTQPHRPVRELAADVPPELTAVVDRALIKDRSQRIGQARELAERLEAALAAMPSAARQMSTTQRRVVRFPSSPHLTPAPRSGRLGVTTQGTWSEGGQARSRSSVLVGAAVGAALLAAGAVAALQLRAGPAPVAARSSMMLTASLARLDRRIAEVKEQVAAEERARAEAQARAAEEELARARAEEEEEKKRAEARKKQAPRGPWRTGVHGGVENPGF